MAPTKEDLQRVEIESAADLKNWLARHHTQTESVWLVSCKKHVAHKYVAYDEIVDAVVSFGWIDSQVRKLDEDRSMLLLSPRKRGSAWSKVNKDRVARLAAAGLIHPAGQAKVDAAKRDGSWSFLDDVEALIKPADLVAAFERHPGAAENFDAFGRSAQRALLEWIKLAKRPETRARRVEETARQAAANRKANQPG